jgi:ABC-2 type transport system ATP-binding protein
MSENVIETNGLTRYYGSRCVVNMLDLAIPRGCVFGFLGRNGAGKSTTIRMLMGLVQPTRGTASILGTDCTKLTPEISARVGYLAEGHHAYGWMSVAEAESFQAGSYSKWNKTLFKTVIGHFRLTQDMKVKDLSRGQRAGLCLALTLAPEPELLILDDPALGLDPVARHNLLQAMVYATRQSGQTILFSSHVLADVERVADRLGVLDEGVLRANCSVETFRQHVKRVVVIFDSGPPKAIPKIDGLLSRIDSGREMILTIANYTPEIDKQLQALKPDRIDQSEMGLEEAFVEYVGKPGEKNLLIAPADMDSAREGALS